MVYELEWKDGKVDLENEGYYFEVVPNKEGVLVYFQEDYHKKGKHNKNEAVFWGKLSQEEVDVAIRRLLKNDDGIKKFRELADEFKGYLGDTYKNIMDESYKEYLNENEYYKIYDSNPKNSGEKALMLKNEETGKSYKNENLGTLDEYLVHIRDLEYGIDRYDTKDKFNYIMKYLERIEEMKNLIPDRYYEEFDIANKVEDKIKDYVEFNILDRKWEKNGQEIEGGSIVYLKDYILEDDGKEHNLKVSLARYGNEYSITLKDVENKEALSISNYIVKDAEKAEDYIKNIDRIMESIYYQHRDRDGEHPYNFESIKNCIKKNTVYLEILNELKSVSAGNYEKGHYDYKTSHVHDERYKMKENYHYDGNYDINFVKMLKDNGDITLYKLDKANKKRESWKIENDCGKKDIELFDRQFTNFKKMMESDEKKMVKSNGVKKAKKGRR